MPLLALVRPGGRIVMDDVTPLRALPGGPLLLIPMAVLAAGLPFGRSRNFGLMATFLTPLVVVLIDVLTPTGWRLAGERLIDTLLGCAIVLLIGYAPWPMSWHSHLPRQFPAGRAQAADVPGPARRSLLRRKASRALADLRAEYQRAMSEPRP